MSGAITVLSLDPSSTCCGYALGEVDPARGVVTKWIEIGRFTPDRAKDPWSARIDAICREVRDAVALWTPTHPIGVCVVEAPAKPQGRSAMQATAGMWVYGMAVGAVMQASASIGAPGGRELVDPADWARGRGSKDNHKLQAARSCPLYSPERDFGGDTADAILILEWWAARQRGREAAGQPLGQQAAGKKKRRASA